jgi:hypothetical protein
MNDDANFLTWLNEEDKKTIADIIDDSKGVPKYLLPERSIIEEQINYLRVNYEVPEELEARLDELVFAYNSKVEPALKAVQRWKVERGKTKWALHALLYIEQPDIWAAVECLEELAAASKDLCSFVMQLKERNVQPVPHWLEGISEEQR